MVQHDVPTPDFGEGQVAGSEINNRSGRRYSFEGHYLANDGTIVYRATLEAVDGTFCGELSGTFDHGPDRPDLRAHVESLVRAAIRESLLFRP